MEQAPEGPAGEQAQEENAPTTGRPLSRRPVTLDETRSVKVGLDREELMAEFALLAEEERAEMERAQALFTEAVHHLQLYSQLDVDTISHLLSVLEDSGRDEGGAWEYFFREGMHQVLLVLLNAGEVAEEARRCDQILQLWERIFRFVFKLSVEDQHVVYEELRRQGMIETLALAMRHHPHHHPVLRRGAFLLAQLYKHDKPTDSDPDDLPATQRMIAAGGLTDRFLSIEAEPSHFSPDLIAQVRQMREAMEGNERRGSDAEQPSEQQQQQQQQQPPPPPPPQEESRWVEDSERYRKPVEEKRPPSRGSDAQDTAEAYSHAQSEKAPLLSTHPRHAVHQVVTGDGCCSACTLM